LKRAIIAAFLIALPGAFTPCRSDCYAKDAVQTEEVIDNILNSSPEKQPSGPEKDQKTAPAGGDKKEAMAQEEKNTVPAKTTGKEKRKTTTKEETASKVSNEEQLLMETGVNFFNSGMYEQSRKVFQDLSTKFPQGTYKVSVHFWFGKIFLKQYQYDDAIKEFAAVTPDSGDYPASIYYLGETYRIKGDQASSIEYFQKVQALFPTHDLADKALLNAGKLYLGQQKGAQALESAVKLIKQYKDRDTISEAYYLMGKVYEKDPRLKDIETARSIYRQFLKKGETDERFSKSPLKKRVQEDLRRIEKTYFKMEK
jgi:TolA-binding protein